ncbi:MAG: YhbY family RNA-binding protein [Oscillospiraceae bacterium]|nr:YhbY family RNA-binding protein [Oscillospiraceae bacterium]
MTSKQRAELKSKSNKLEPVFQLGKNGITESFIRQTEKCIEALELIKIKVLLDTSPVPPKEAAREIAEKTKSEVVQVIGGVIILYRYNPRLKKR